MEHTEEKSENVIEQSKNEDKKANRLEVFRSFFKVEDIKDNPKIEYYCLFAILFIGFLLRVIWLGDLPLSEDEAYTLTPAKRLITGEGFNYLTSLFYTFLQYMFFYIFGVSETVGRMPTAIFGTACAYVMYLFCKKFINKRVAFLILILVSFSFFEVFMSRLARPYTLLQLLCIVLSWLLILIFKDPVREEGGDNNFLNVFKLISIKYILIFFFLFLFSMFVHSWALLFWVTAIFYFFIMFFYMLGSKNYGVEKYLYLVFGITFILITILGWLVLEADLFTGLFQGQSAIDIFSPNLARIYEFLKDDPFIGILHYLKLISYDFDYLWIFGIIGFCSSFFVIQNKKALLVIHSMLFSNLIVLGFFMDSMFQRYFFQAYSFYLVYPAIGIYAIYLVCLKFFKDEKYLRYREIILGVLIILILFVSIPFTFFENLFTLKMHRNVYINDKMEEYTFYPYRDACKYIQKNIKPGEEVICVAPRIAEFYIDRDVRSLRNVSLNINIFNVADEFIGDTTVHENSLENHPSFMNFIQTHKLGWAIIDPRVNTAVSRITRDFIFSNMDFHILGSVPLGLIFVASWNNNTISKEPQMFRVFCSENVSEDFFIGNIEDVMAPNTFIKLTVIYSGVEKPNEALCIVGNEQDYLPPNLSLEAVNTAQCYVKAVEFIKSGTINFIYNTDCGDPTGGFFIHDIEIATDDR